jgi:hypothetical protein
MIPLMLRAVLLDVNGTLTDPSAIGAVWARPDLGEHVLQHAISTAMVRALLHDAGRPFRDHLSAAIESSSLPRASILTPARKRSTAPRRSPRDPAPPTRSQRSATPICGSSR